MSSVLGLKVTPKKVTIKKAKKIQEGTAIKTENFKEDVKNLTNKAKNKIKKKE